MESNTFDVAVIGGGIVGVATAMALVRSPGLSVVVLEAEDRLAAHQTGNNSGVIHSGLYYKPGSLKAKNCAEGRDSLYRFCAEHGIAFERCGKLVVATSPSELTALDQLEQRGRLNGLSGLRRIGPEEIRELEPHVSGIAGLHVPETGIVDYCSVTEAFAKRVREAGGEVRLSTRLKGVVREEGGMVLETSRGEVRCGFLVNCAGLQSDRVARLAGVDPGLRIVPFRGEYYEVVPERAQLVRNLVYPVPDPAFPFLGVHFTRMIRGGLEAGPNAVLALKRHGYRKWSFSAGDVLEFVLYPGFWRMAARHWRMGLGEALRSLSKRAFVRALQRLVPELDVRDVRQGGAGVRAQALERNGALSDDFRIVHADRMVHVLNAPSPAATASISIGRTVASAVLERIGREPA
ncbi:MAG: L-2-hydroxyglutarate oxidase [Deltaproteobacteria bacterium]|nr:L-2-hydroxyglutarate oxidase [Deltaproteobacteria bacterium]